MAPVAPVAPVIPVAPVAPVDPVDPVAPVAPIDPVTPVEPAGPAKITSVAVDHTIVRFTFDAFPLTINPVGSTLTTVTYPD